MRRATIVAAAFLSLNPISSRAGLPQVGHDFLSEWAKSLATKAAESRTHPLLKTVRGLPRLMDKEAEAAVEHRAAQMWAQADGATRGAITAQAAELDTSIAHDLARVEAEEGPVKPACKPQIASVARDAACYCLKKYSTGRRPETKAIMQYLEAAGLKMALDCASQRFLARVGEMTNKRAAECLKEPIDELKKQFVKSIEPTPEPTASPKEEETHALLLLDKFCGGG